MSIFIEPYSSPTQLADLPEPLSNIDHRAYNWCRLPHTELLLHPKISSMPLDAQGAFLRLMSHSARQNPFGSLPSDIDTLIGLLGVPYQEGSKTQLRLNKLVHQALRAGFTHCRDGRLYCSLLIDQLPTSHHTDTSSAPPSQPIGQIPQTSSIQTTNDALQPSHTSHAHNSHSSHAQQSLSDKRREAGRRGGQRTASAHKSEANLKQNRFATEANTEAKLVSTEANTEAKLVSIEANTEAKLVSTEANTEAKLVSTEANTEAKLVSTEAKHPITEAKPEFTEAKPEFTEAKSKITEANGGIKGGELDSELEKDLKEKTFVDAAAPKQSVLLAQEVFEYWKIKFSKMATTKFDQKRKGKVLARLKDGYSLDQIKQAIDGCAASEYHLTHHYTDLELICRDAGHMDRFIALATKPTGHPSVQTPITTQGHMHHVQSQPTPAPHSRPQMAINQFEGIELIKFKELKQHLPDLTQQQIRTLASEQNQDVLVLMTQMIKQHQQRAAMKV